MRVLFVRDDGGSAVDVDGLEGLGVWLVAGAVEAAQVVGPVVEWLLDGGVLVDGEWGV